MKRATIIMCGTLSGCYASFRPAVSAPVGHGHGGAGFELDFAGGVEHFDKRLRAGGGVNSGLREVGGTDYISLGFDGHIAVAVGGQQYNDRFRPIVVANAVLGFGAGRTDVPQDPGGAGGPTIFFTQAFAGFGFGSPTTQLPSYKVRAGHVALGLTATRYWPDVGGPFWTLGVAFEMSGGFLQGL